MQKEIQTELVNWLNLSTQRTMDEFVHFIRKRGLTLQQMNLMMFLYYHGSCEMSHLVEPLQIGKSAVSQIVERLVKLGYLERVEVEGDRRARLVKITAAAEQTILEGIVARQIWLENESIDLTDEDQKHLLQVLKTLNQIYAIPAREKNP
jgi:MarR family transcriptional regulator, transcriptional regulator for hemolysin